MKTHETKNLYFVDSQNQDKFLKIVSRCSIFLLLCFLTFTMPSLAKAAIMSLEPSEGEFNQGETFIEKIKLNTEGEDINAVQVNLDYPENILEIVDFSDGGSILKIWAERPIIKGSEETTNKDEGILSFIGGVPNGFKGEGILGKIIFKIRTLSKEKIQDLKKDVKIKFLEGTQVLLNDGKGTKAKLTTMGATFKVITKGSEIIKDEWQSTLEGDNTPPERFEIQLSRELSMFEGKYFISFWTIDKQSGLDHYEIKEGEGEWKEITSPYILQDQKLESIIRVKAVDKAGNERIEVLNPSRESFINWIALAGFLVVIGWVIYTAIKNQIFKKPK